MPLPVLPDRTPESISMLPGHEITRRLVIEGPPQEWVADCSCLWVSKQGNLDFATGASVEHLRVVWTVE